MANFGLSKTKESNYSIQTFNTCNITYKAKKEINLYKLESRFNVVASINIQSIQNQAMYIIFIQCIN